MIERTRAAVRRTLTIVVAMAVTISWAVGAAPAGAAGKVEYVSKGIGRGTWLQEVLPGQDGAMWFAGYDPKLRSVIVRVTRRGRVKEFRRGLPRSGRNNVDSIGSLTWGPDGNLWFIGLRSASIGRMTPRGNVTMFKRTLPPRFKAGGILKAKDGQLYVPATWRAGGSKTRGFVRIAADGSLHVTPLAGSNTTPGGTVAGDGNYWTFVDLGKPAGGAFERISPTGETTRFSDGLGDLRYACGAGPKIATDGRIWCAAITTSNQSVLLRLDPLTGSLARFTTSDDAASPTYARPGGGWWYLTGTTGRGGDGRSAASGTLALSEITPDGRTSRLATTRLARGPQRQACVGADNRVYYQDLPNYNADNGGSSRIVIRSLGPGDTAARAVGKTRKRYESSDSFRLCTEASNGDLWFIDNSTARRNTKPERQHPRLGHIVIRLG